MIDLKGKRILMFSPYGATKHYGVAIQKELERRGAIVKGYDERPSQNSLTKIVIRLFKKKVPQIFNKYIDKIISENKDVAFDFVLICRGEAFTPATIAHIRKAFPKIKVILYLWDVMHECAMKDVVPFCDKAMSFDPDDVSNTKGLDFRPTFYVEEYEKVKKTNCFKHDLCFVGTLYTPRHKLIKRLESAFENQGIDLYTYLYVPGILVYIKEFLLHFPFYNIKKVKFNPLSLSAGIEMLDSCKCILDLNPPYQRSLSTRAHEAMAARRKYITPNRAIMNYEYYNPNNILIIDIDNPVIPRNFLDSPFEDVSDAVRYKYSVKGLVDDLFS